MHSLVLVAALVVSQARSDPSSVTGGTRQGYSVREVGGKQWTGTYSNNGQLAAVRNECENHARSKAGEADVTCSCSLDRAP